MLTLVGEPKSPHGCDVTPDGKAIVVGGKLDTHATVYDFAKIKTLIEREEVRGQGRRTASRSCAFKDAIRGQVEIGLGPLHTVFDDKGNAYTSVFIESKVAKWNVKDLKSRSRSSRSTTTSATSSRPRATRSARTASTSSR